MLRRVRCVALRERAAAVETLVAGRSDVSLQFHEQCFAEDGHFAGSDDVRLAALLDCANDPGFDAVWFAMGGYGSNRESGNFRGRRDGRGGRVWRPAGG